MAPQARSLIFLAALSVLGLQWAAAQEPAPETALNIPWVSPGDSPVSSPAQPMATEPALENLTPEQREQLRKNLERWNKLSKERQDQLRREERFRSERIAKEINNAIKKSGLKLNAQQREFFTVRYTKERRVIEEKLRAEMEKKRKEAVTELLRALVAEFQPIPPALISATAPATTNSEAAPAPTAAPAP